MKRLFKKDQKVEISGVDQDVKAYAFRYNESVPARITYVSPYFISVIVEPHISKDPLSWGMMSQEYPVAIDMFDINSGKVKVIPR